MDGVHAVAGKQRLLPCPLELGYLAAGTAGKVSGELDEW